MKRGESTVEVLQNFMPGDSSFLLLPEMITNSAETTVPMVVVDNDFLLARSNNQTKDASGNKDMQ